MIAELLGIARMAHVATVGNISASVPAAATGKTG